ncbi:MAG: hypothetical protein ACO3FJ_09090, partial [Ilumatobacteraceae bacterium]
MACAGRIRFDTRVQQTLHHRHKDCDERQPCSIGWAVTTMRIFDCILFNQEHDMLECRLSELGDVVDKMIIVESSTTFMGQPKPHGIDLDRFY